MIVECIAITGDETSEIAQSLSASLVNEGISARFADIGRRRVPSRVLRRSLLAGRELLRSPIATLSLLATVGPRRSARPVVEVLSMRALVRRARRHDVVYLFDRAALTTIERLGAGERMRELLARPSWSWVLPDVVVAVHPPERADEGAIERLDPMFRWWASVETPGRSRWVLELDLASEAERDVAVAECATDLGALRHRVPAKAAETTHPSTVAYRTQALRIDATATAGSATETADALPSDRTTVQRELTVRG